MPSGSLIMSATSTLRTAEHNSIRGMVFPTLGGSCPFPSRKLRVASEPAGPKCCRNATVARVKVLAQPDKDLLVEVLFHFHHSLNRKEKYFTDTEPIKILKHCSTRWLSLEKCVNRLLHHWSALQSYFNSHEDVEKPGRVKGCASATQRCIYTSTSSASLSSP